MSFISLLKPIVKSRSEPDKWPYSNYRTHSAPDGKGVSPSSPQQSASDRFGG